MSNVVKNVILTKSGVPITTSLNIAYGTDVQHKNVLALIKKFVDKFQELGGVAFRTRTIQTNGGPQQQEYVILNEDQAVFCLTLMRNSDVVVDFKLRLVKEFREALNKVAELQRQKHEQNKDAAWVTTRKLGIEMRRLFTDVLKEHGVSGYGYAHVTDDINRTLFGSTAKQIKKKISLEKGIGVKKVRTRDHLDGTALALLHLTEQGATNRIEDQDAQGTRQCRGISVDVAQELMRVIGADKSQTLQLRKL